MPYFGKKKATLLQPSCVTWSEDVSTNKEQSGKTDQEKEEVVTPVLAPGAICFNVRAIINMASTLKQLLVPNGGTTATGQGSAQPGLDSDPNLKQEVKAAALDSLDTLTSQPQSPLPEADYDKLLVSEKKRLHTLVLHYFLIFDIFLMWYKTVI